MNNQELKDLLVSLDSSMDDELRVFFENSEVKSYFSRLIRIMLLDNSSFDGEVIRKLDVLTDDLDSFNFCDAKQDINDLLDLL